ncbi:hypothetical protein FBUS_00341 [Fasciolopsis buskii]|uniref:Uncharacterized protein n=1 Tax=Fasciolopsis buskii TaxID=27845 RepID=A0A8E0RWN0_9TREM|nr:hypothetical protein FBUS_00341 [Fasciolopsis buski]
MATRVETVAPVKMRIKRKSSSKPLAENLFGKRFSKLTIEDEYNYNLEYLISETKPTRWIENPPKNVNATFVDQAKHFQRWIPERESEYSPVRETTIDGCKPLAKHIENYQTKQNNDAEAIYKYPKSKNLVIGRPPLNRSGAISMPVMCDSSPIEERRRFKPKVFTRPDGSIHIERLQPPARAMASSHSSTDSTYPGLHIYVTESPPRPYYEVISPIEPPIKHAPRRTVACDPINVSYPSCALSKSERTSSPVPQGEREERDFKGRDNPMRKSIEQIEPRSVASRVEAFMALLQPKEETRPQDNHYPNKSPIIIESRIKSPNEVSSNSYKMFLSIIT